MAGSHSDKISEVDRRMAVYLRDMTYFHTDEIKKHSERILFYARLQEILKICKRCHGSGTICETRTEDDSPFYEPCPDCGGRGRG